MPPSWPLARSVPPPATPAIVPGGRITSFVRHRAEAMHPRGCSAWRPGTICDQGVPGEDPDHPTTTRCLHPDDLRNIEWSAARLDLIVPVTQAFEEVVRSAEGRLQNKLNVGFLAA